MFIPNNGRGKPYLVVAGAVVELALVASVQAVWALGIGGDVSLIALTKRCHKLRLRGRGRRRGGRGGGEGEEGRGGRGGEGRGGRGGEGEEGERGEGGEGKEGREGGRGGRGEGGEKRRSGEVTVYMYSMIVCYYKS